MTVEHSGGGDPDRSLALLWRGSGGTKDPTIDGTRGRRPTLTLDQVIGAAVALADEAGLPAASMHRVAKSLGVGSMTLYTYVPSKAELIDLMVDHALRERELPGPGEPRPDGWRAQVELHVERTRAVFHRHPWLRQVSTIRPALGPGMMAGQEYLLSAFSGLGLTPWEVTATANAVGAFVDAAMRLEVEDVQVERATGKSQDAWWQEREIFWEKYFDGDRYPTMVRLWNVGGFDYEAGADATGDPHAFGLARLLDGVQAMVDRSSVRQAPGRPD